MSAPQAEGRTRRRFRGGLTVAGAAGLLGLRSQPVAAEPHPETGRLRLVKFPVICLAPEYLAEELLHLEGFSEIAYVQIDQGTPQDLLLSDKADIAALVPPALLPDLDVGSLAPMEHKFTLSSNPWENIGFCMLLRSVFGRRMCMKKGPCVCLAGYRPPNNLLRVKLRAGGARDPTSTTRGICSRQEARTGPKYPTPAPRLW
jgi:hypothetical protein